METTFSLTIKNSDKLCSDIEASKEEKDLHKVICRFLKETNLKYKEAISLDEFHSICEHLSIISKLLAVSILVVCTLKADVNFALKQINEIFQMLRENSTSTVKHAENIIYNLDFTPEKNETEDSDSNNNPQANNQTQEPKTPVKTEPIIPKNDQNHSNPEVESNQRTNPKQEQSRCFFVELSKIERHIRIDNIQDLLSLAYQSKEIYLTDVETKESLIGDIKHFYHNYNSKINLLCLKNREIKRLSNGSIVNQLKDEKHKIIILDEFVNSNWESQKHSFFSHKALDNFPSGLNNIGNSLFITSLLYKLNSPDFLELP